MEAQEEVAARVRQFMARHNSGVSAEDVATWLGPLMRGAIVAGPLRGEAEEGCLIWTLGASKKLEFEFSEPVLALGAVRSIAARLAFALDEYVSGPQQIIAPDSPVKAGIGSPEMAAYIQSISGQVRTSAFNPYGFEARILWELGDEAHPLAPRASGVAEVFQPLKVPATWTLLTSAAVCRANVCGTVSPASAGATACAHNGASAPNIGNVVRKTAASWIFIG
jgi:hypothetical protein